MLYLWSTPDDTIANLLRISLPIPINIAVCITPLHDNTFSGNDCPIRDIVGRIVFTRLRSLSSAIHDPKIGYNSGRGKMVAYPFS